MLLPAIHLNVSPCLIIVAAVWCGFLARHLGCFSYNRTNPSKVDDISDDNSYKKSDNEISFSANLEDDNSYKESDNEISFSANLEDRFSELPNEILSCILTHLTLRDVARMTTLSKQWKNIWSLLSDLDLNWQVMSGFNGFCSRNWCELHRQVYVKRVNKVLQAHDIQDISSFRISFCFTKEYSIHVDQWISFASKQCLESLTLQFNHKKSIILYKLQKDIKPEDIYTITSSFLSQFPCMKNLRLELCTLKLHSDFRFNKLVRLDLYYVYLEGNQLQWLLSNSSTIEWLRIRRCNLPAKLCIGDNLQRLSSLMIHDSDLLELELNAKSLNFFDFVGKASVKLSFLSAAKLESTNVVLLDKNYKGAERIFRDLATSFPSLETLLLQGFYSLIHVLPTDLSTSFRRVVRLSLYFQNEDPEADMVKSFPRLLNCFQQLQKLYLMVPFPSDLPRRYELPDVCLNTSLKEVELGNFQVDWIPCANYFLKCTAVLDRMLISCYTNIYTRDGEWKRFGHCFSEQECDYIRLALQGNAVSPKADLIIQ